MEQHHPEGIVFGHTKRTKSMQWIFNLADPYNPCQFSYCTMPCSVKNNVVLVCQLLWFYGMYANIH